MMNTQNSRNDDDHIENAEEIIELFGGIRPMAKKVDVAVTTIQGWKKRGVIPASRRDSIVEAAEEHGVDLSGIIGGQANQNEKSETAILSEAASDLPRFKINEEPAQIKAERLTTSAQEQTLQEEVFQASFSQKQEKVDTKPDITALEERLKKLERKAVSKAVTTNTIITVILLGGVLGAAYMLLDPFAPRQQVPPQQMAIVEKEVVGVKRELETVKEEQRSLRDLVPSNLRERLDELQRTGIDAKAAVGAAIERADALSRDVLGENAGTFDQRLSALETSFHEFMGSDQMKTLNERLNELQSSATGQQQLDSTVSELNSIVMSSEGEPSRIDTALEAARVQGTALSQTFEGVPQEDIKAAAMLLAFSQLRQSLNRNNEPFEDDLVLLMNFVGNNDPALTASLEKLAPHANRGVLSPEGLSSEFRTLAGDAVVASLKGEDISVQDKAKARLNEIFSVEKDGELVTGTETQAQINKTQNLLESGDLEAAIAMASQIDGPAASVIAPWLEKAQATLTAQKTDSLISSVLSANLKDVAGQVIGGELYMNSETGIKIYKPARPFKQLQLDGAR